MSRRRTGNTTGGSSSGGSSSNAASGGYLADNSSFRPAFLQTTSKFLPQTPTTGLNVLLGSPSGSSGRGGGGGDVVEALAMKILNESRATDVLAFIRVEESKKSNDGDEEGEQSPPDDLLIIQAGDEVKKLFVSQRETWIANYLRLMKDGGTIVPTVKREKGSSGGSGSSSCATTVKPIDDNGEIEKRYELASQGWTRLLSVLLLFLSSELVGPSLTSSPMIPANGSPMPSISLSQQIGGVETDEKGQVLYQQLHHSICTAPNGTLTLHRHRQLSYPSSSALPKRIMHLLHTFSYGGVYSLATVSSPALVSRCYIAHSSYSLKVPVPHLLHPTGSHPTTSTTTTTANSTTNFATTVKSPEPKGKTSEVADALLALSSAIPATQASTAPTAATSKGRGKGTSAASKASTGLIDMMLGAATDADPSTVLPIQGDGEKDKGSGMTLTRKNSKGKQLKDKEVKEATGSKEKDGKEKVGKKKSKEIDEEEVEQEEVEEGLETLTKVRERRISETSFALTQKTKSHEKDKEKEKGKERDTKDDEDNEPLTLKTKKRVRISDPFGDDDDDEKIVEKKGRKSESVIEDEIMMTQIPLTQLPVVSGNNSGSSKATSPGGTPLLLKLKDKAAAASNTNNKRKSEGDSSSGNTTPTGTTIAGPSNETVTTGSRKRGKIESIPDVPAITLPTATTTTNASTESDKVESVPLKRQASKTKAVTTTMSNTAKSNEIITVPATTAIVTAAVPSTGTVTTAGSSAPSLVQSLLQVKGTLRKCQEMLHKDRQLPTCFDRSVQGLLSGKGSFVVNSSNADSDKMMVISEIVQSINQLCVQREDIEFQLLENLDLLSTLVAEQHKK